jgi:soluble lytic murein transglycosylase-like protein
MPSAIKFGLFAAVALCTPLARAAEHITLTEGREIDCQRSEPQGDKLRLYFAGENYMEVPAASVLKIEATPDTVVPAPAAPVVAKPVAPVPPQLELKELLAHAGAQYNIDAELLAAVVHAESNGQVRAVSRTGARGLMQLMPGTAAELGVKDAFVPGQNVEGGTLYLDQLLTRYHDNIALALAAYNAGPAAVDRYHGHVPPYRETQAYVARIIHEFNRRKTALLASANPSTNAGVPHSSQIQRDEREVRSSPSQVLAASR